MKKAVVAGLGSPGVTITTAFLRRGVHVIACDPRLVELRTLERVYGVADVKRPKAWGMTRLAESLGLGALLDARAGRFEEAIGGSEVREADVVVVAADRPSATFRAAEICLRMTTASHPLKLVTAHVGEGSAQARTFELPLRQTPCPVCGPGSAYLAALADDLSFSCDGAEARNAEGGDRYTVPFGVAESMAAATLALSLLDSSAPAGVDTTLSLVPYPPSLHASQVEPDPDCPVQCASIAPWPAASHTISSIEGIAGQLVSLAQLEGLDAGSARVEFLRPLAIGQACGCGTHEGLRLLSPCGRCHGPVVPLQGWTYELSVEQLVSCGRAASTRDIGLPARDLILLTDGNGCRRTVAIESEG